jgi:hypothetical protein
MDKRNTFLEKKHRGGVRGGVETETMMSAGEGPSSGRPHAPGIEENRNAKRCCNWICACAGEMAAKRETTMSVGEEPSGGGVNPMPETRVLNWILSDSDEGPSSGKEERAGKRVAKWARGLPHIYEHKCLATTKRCRGSSEEGVDNLIFDSGNDHDDGEASFSESHCLFYLFYSGA